MKVKAVTPILNVRDVPASLAWFEQLGWFRSFTWNEHGGIEGAADGNEHGPANFAGVSSGEAQVFLCRDGQGSRGGPEPRHTDGGDDTGGVWMSWWVPYPADVDAAYQLALARGIDVLTKPVDEPWGVREFQIRHPDGHTIRFGAGIGED